MNFKQAFKLILGIHEQCGDKYSWMNCKEMLEEDTRKYTSFHDWRQNQYRRTDRSQDQQWMLEEMDASTEVLFSLMFPEQVNPKPPARKGSE